VDSQTDKDEILKLHNDYRKNHGAPGLAWSSELASGAQSWAKECTWQHSPGSSRKDQGENLYASLGRPASSSYSSAASSWYNEVALYDYDNPGKPEFKDIGHFTQMVWKGSKDLGCARELCTGGGNSPFNSDGDWIFVVCRYSPAGNVLSGGNNKYAVFQENVLKPGSDVEPVAAPVSCSGKVKTVQFKLRGIGSSCAAGAGKSAMKAANLLGDFLVCKWSYQCKQKGSTTTVSAKIKVPASQVDGYVESMKSAIQGGKLYDLWSTAQGATIKPSGKKQKVCAVGAKGC